MRARLQQSLPDRPYFRQNEDSGAQDTGEQRAIPSKGLHRLDCPPKPLRETAVPDRQSIQVPGLKTIGPYSQAVRATGLLFVSGQPGVDPSTGLITAGC